MGSVWQPKNQVLACRGGFRFEVCFGFTIRDFVSPLFLSLSCVSKLGNTNKCYPPLCGNISKLEVRHTPPPLTFSLLLFCTFWNIFLYSCPSGPAFLVSLTIPWWGGKRSLTWNQMLVRLNLIHFPHSHTFGTVSSCPSSQKNYLHIPEKKILLWLEALQNIVTFVLPQRGAHVSEGSIFSHVDISFLIYRIFLIKKIALNSKRKCCFL